MGEASQGEVPKNAKEAEDVNRKLDMALDDLVVETKRFRGDRGDGNSRRDWRDNESGRRRKAISRSRSRSREEKQEKHRSSRRHRSSHKHADGDKPKEKSDDKSSQAKAEASSKDATAAGGTPGAPPAASVRPVVGHYPGHPPMWGYPPPHGYPPHPWGYPPRGYPPPGYPPHPWGYPPVHPYHARPPPGQPGRPPPGQPQNGAAPPHAAPGAVDPAAGRRGFQVRLTNVPPELAAPDLAEAFTHVITQGRVESVDVLRDTRGQATGDATIIFSNLADAQNAVARYNGGDLNGRRLQVALQGEVIFEHR